MADYELERQLSILRGLLLEATPSYSPGEVGTDDSAQSSIDHDDGDGDSRVSSGVNNPSFNEAAHLVLPSKNDDNEAASEEESEDEVYDEDEDEDGADPLWLAAAHGDAIGVETLLKQGGAASIRYLLGTSNTDSEASSSESAPNDQVPATPPTADDSATMKEKAQKRSTPLAAASARGHTAVVQVLLATAMAELEAGETEEPGATDEALGCSGSSSSASGNFLQFVDAPNPQGSTSLLLAAARGCHEVVLCLLAAGADPSKANVYGETPLFTAALDGHCHVCECVLAAAAARNLPSSSMTTVDEESTDSSSSSSSFVEVADAEGTSPLLAAVQGGHLEVARLLLEHGATPNTTNARHVAPLLVATLAGDARLVRLLLASGANPEGPFKGQEAENEDDEGVTSSLGQSPLLIAARWGHLSVVRLLLAHGANPNTCNASSSRRGPLHCCAAQANLSSRAAVATLLVEGGAHVNARDDSGATPLWLASAGGHFAMVKVLLTRGEGAHVDCPIHDGATPLFIASAMGHDEVVALLVAHGASSARVSAFVQQSTSASDSTAATEMVDSDRSCVNHSSDDDCSDEEAVGEHIRDQKDDEDNEEEGAEVAERDASALTANTTPPVLWQCAQRGDSEGLAQILAHRLRPTSNGSIPSSSSSNSSSSYGEGGSFLDVNVVWEGGVSALLVAAANGHATCCTLLLKAGANPDLGDDQGTTALMMAAQEGHAAVVSALLSDHHHYNDMEPADNDRLENSETKCASVNLADSDGTTPLLLAAEEGHLECCRYLLAAGAAQVPGAEGFTPLEAATEAGHVQVAALLRAALMQ